MTTMLKVTAMRVVTNRQLNTRSLLSIITVYGEKTSDCVAQIEEQLNRNPSRRQYLEAWNEGGRFIDVQMVDMESREV